MAGFGYNASDEELAQLEQLRQELVRVYNLNRP